MLKPKKILPTPPEINEAYTPFNANYKQKIHCYYENCFQVFFSRYFFLGSYFSKFYINYSCTVRWFFQIIGLIFKSTYFYCTSPVYLLHVVEILSRNTYCLWTPKWKFKNLYLTAIKNTRVRKKTNNNTISHKCVLEVLWKQMRLILWFLRQTTLLN